MADRSDGSRPATAAGSRPWVGRIAGAFRAIPLEAALVGAGLFVLLAAFVAADPAAHMTFSVSPFTDEAFNTVNARNFVQLGPWSTDEWNLHLVNLPFSLVEAVTFRVLGVGTIQARLPMILFVSLTATALVWGLRSLVGRPGALFAGLAFGCSSLVLFYGRLAFLEDLVVTGLTLGTLVLARDSRLTLRWGLVSGASYAAAMGAKPSASFAAIGILAAIGLALAWRDRPAARWLAGAIAAIAVAGLVWAVVIWLPNREAVSMDFRIWEQFQLSLTPQALWRSLVHYLSGSDQVLGPMLAPLLGLAAAGIVAIAALRRRLGRAEARMALAAFAWAVFGFGILVAVQYRPNRYVVPLVPALAILAAIGLHLVGQWLVDVLGRRAEAARDTRAMKQSETQPETAGTAAAAIAPGGAAAGAAADGTAAGPLAKRGRLARMAVTMLMAVAIALASGPGLWWYATWAAAPTYDLAHIQDDFAALVPAGQSVAGRDSALYLMKSNAVTLITQVANEQDLYARGTRYYLLPSDATAPHGVTPAIWAARQTVRCASYGGVTECLFHVP
jgi:hypothetical protein